jgi:hypothetical protein
MTLLMPSPGATAMPAPAAGLAVKLAALPFWMCVMPAYRPLRFDSG